jgi:hypothetical protein
LDVGFTCRQPIPRRSKRTNTAWRRVMITAPQLARAYDLSVASLWRGEAADELLIAWLGRFRAADAPPEPRTAPDAVSLLGGGGNGIRWYSTPSAVLGFATGRPGVCYRIPVEAELPKPRPVGMPESLVPVELAGTAV